MNIQSIESDALLTPSEVAAILYVDPKTVTRWAIAGKLNSVRTPGGHRRFLKSEILALMTGVNHSPNRAPWPSAGYPASVSTSFATDPRGTTYPQNGTSSEADEHAAAVVGKAVAIAREAQAARTAHAVIVTGDAVAAAAERVASAVETARSDRTSAAAEAAEAVATNAACAAAAIQLRADASALKLKEAAARAAAIVAAANLPGRDREAALTALQVAATVKDVAVATAEDTAAAAVLVASAVTAAAAEVAFRVSALDSAIESEVARVAAALQSTATATARRVAADTDARASEIAMVAGQAAAASGSVDLYSESPTPNGPAAPLPAQATAFSSLTRR